MKEVVIGIDIGGTYTKYGIVDRQGNCLADSFISTEKYREFDDYLKYLMDEVQSTLKEIPGSLAVKGVEQRIKPVGS